jgi:hypothetical protein
MRRFGIATVIGALLLPAGAHRAQAVQRLMDVRQIATDTLHDLAVAAFENGRPVIYYNPVLMQRVGPELETYFFAHEYGHVHYGHTGSALTAGEGDLGALRVRQELEADCYAARTLADTDHEAVDAAIRFFTRMGPFRFDAWHPSGAQRAAKILSCLPESAAPTDMSDSGKPPHHSVGRSALAAAPPELLPN